MKYQQFLAFQKHLHQSAPDHLAHLYLVAAACPYERKKIVEEIFSTLRLKHKKLQIRFLEAGQANLETLLLDLSCLSLFGGIQAIYLDGIDKLKKPMLTLLTSFILQPKSSNPSSYVILGASSNQSLNELYTKGKKELIVCDLTQEKPWEKKERLKRFSLQFAKTLGKTLEEDAINSLLERIGMDLPGLEQALFKLFTYVGERAMIQRSDVEKLCQQVVENSLWQQAEWLVWKEIFPSHLEKWEISDLLGFITSVRSQLQLGLSIAVFLKQGFDFQKMVHALPMVKPASLEKWILIARQKKPFYFKRGLQAVFETEVLAKNSSFSPSFLLDLFRAKWQVH